MEEEMKVEYLRTRGRKHAFAVSAVLLERGDMFPCDAKGNFLGSGTSQLVPDHIAEEKPAASDDHKEEMTEVDSMLIALRSRAKELKIRGAHNMKEGKLITRIEEAEMALTAKA